MASLPVTMCGDKILRKKVAKVTQVDNENIKLIKNMFDTMRNANGIGLAANQVGADRAIIIVDISLVEGFEEIKPIVLINPEITKYSDEKSVLEEGCLSIPDIREEVVRPKAITITYQDTDLKEHTLEADSLLARVIQHEYDHLQGILFTDLVNDESKKRLKKPLSKIKRRKIEVEYPISDSVDYQLFFNTEHRIMKIIFMGTPDFAIPSLKILVESKHEVLAVVTSPDKQRGRGQKISFTPVKKFAFENNLPVLQPEKLKNNSQLVEDLKKFDADLYVVVAFRILPPEVFNIPKFGSFNLHGSYLPKYRGAAPIQWALINGETETGLTTFKLAEKVDTGNIYLQKKVEIFKEDSLGTLHDRLSEIGATSCTRYC